MKRFKHLVNTLKLILGLDTEWKDAFDVESEIRMREVQEDFNRRNMFISGHYNNAVVELEILRHSQKMDEKRKRLIEGLGVIPGWLALIISILGLIIAFVK